MKISYRWKRLLRFVYSNSQTRRWITQGVDMKKMWQDKVSSSDSCLDAGCGGGSYAIEHFLKHGASCVLIDLDENLLSLAKEQILDNRLSDKAEIIHGNLENLVVENRLFTRIQCLEVLEHLHNPDHILQVLRNLSVPKTLLMVSVPHPPEWVPNSSHVKEGYTRGELENLLNRTGWEVIDTCYCMLWPTRALKWLNSKKIPVHFFQPLLVLENLIPKNIRKYCNPYGITMLAKPLP